MPIRHGENRYSRFESVDLPHMRPLPDRDAGMRTQWRKNDGVTPTTTRADRTGTSSSCGLSVCRGKEVDVRLARAGDRCLPPRPADRSAISAASAKGRATTTASEHQPQRINAVRRRRALATGWSGTPRRYRSPCPRNFVVAVMERNPNPEFGFRSCYGVLRLANGHEPERFDAAMPLRPGARHPDLPWARQHPAYRRRSRRR